MARLIVSLAVALSAAALASCASTAGKTIRGDDAARFEKFKALEGDWSATGQGDAPAGAKVSYRLTPAKSAVVETVFQGTAHEMTTVYTLDHGWLRLTHYCALANQPSMLAEAPKDAAVVDFDLDALGNGEAARDMHMHHARFEFLADDHVRTHWTLWKDGKAQNTVTIDLQRASGPSAGTR